MATMEEAAEGVGVDGNSLPDNVWECVLLDAALTSEDVCGVAAVSRRLLGIARDNRVWRVKFRQRWPRVGEQMAAASDWPLAFRERRRCSAVVAATLERLSGRFIGREESSVPYAPMASLVTDDCGAVDAAVWANFVVDELRSILGDPSEFDNPANHVDEGLGLVRHRNLTAKFYARQALPFVLREFVLKPQLHSWLTGSVDLESGVMLFAQWFQPELHLERPEISSTLDEIALEAVGLIAQSHPKHPLINAVKTNGVANSGLALSFRERKVVFDALAEAFAGRGLVGDSELDDNYDFERSFVNLVLRTGRGRPITLCALFAAAAGRLGLPLESVSFPGRFLLKLQVETDEWVFVDVWRRCKCMDESALWRWHGSISGESARNAEWLQGVSAAAVLMRMLNNVYRGVPPELSDVKVARTALEMAVLLDLADLQCRLLLSKIYMDYYRFNADLVLNLLESVEPSKVGECPFMLELLGYRERARVSLAELGSGGGERPTTARKRPKNGRVKHAVGQVMRHRKYDYRCVIVGWDEKCAAAVSWQKQMGVAKLERGAKQPFYNVLVSDGSNRYAAEDNLVRDDAPSPVTHEHVGKHLCEFAGTSYLMNAAKQAEYPDDAAVAADYARRQYPTSSSA